MCHSQWLICAPSLETTKQHVPFQAVGILQENAQKVQKRLINKPRHPAELAADIVERVLVTGGDRYLDTKYHTLSWWQLSLLDVKLFLTAAAMLVIALIGGLLWLLIKLLMSGLKAWYNTQHRPQTAHKKTS